MDDIKEYDTYTRYMAKSLYDKAFFLDKLDCDTFVDFGCADAALGEFLRRIDPGFEYYGYDKNPVMVDRANTFLGAGRFRNPSFWATSDWYKILDVIDQKKTPVSIVANSVMHEVHDTKDAAVIEDFWTKLFSSGFDYVIIRDMVMPQHHTELTGGRWTELNSMTGADEKSLAAVRAKADPFLVQTFEKRWGTLRNEINLIHFLLKYRFVDNWDHEVEENYLSVTNDTFMHRLNDMCKAWGYHIDYIDRFSLKYIRDQVRRDFGIMFNVKTHTKVILKKDGRA